MCYVLPPYVGDDDDDVSNTNRIVGKECENSISKECQLDDDTPQVVLLLIVSGCACTCVIGFFLSSVRQRGIRSGGYASVL